MVETAIDNVLRKARSGQSISQLINTVQVINHDRSNRNDVIGRALLNLEDQHVVEVLENPGRQVAQWHHLD